MNYISYGKKLILYDLADRLEKVFPSIEDDVVASLLNEKAFQKLHQKLDKLEQQYPVIVKLKEDEGEIFINEKEHKIFLEHSRIMDDINSIERQKIYFQGHTDCMAYLKKINAL